MSLFGSSKKEKDETTKKIISALNLSDGTEPWLKTKKSYLYDDSCIQSPDEKKFLFALEQLGNETALEQIGCHSTKKEYDDYLETLSRAGIISEDFALAIYNTNASSIKYDLGMPIVPEQVLINLMEKFDYVEDVMVWNDILEKFVHKCQICIDEDTGNLMKLSLKTNRNQTFRDKLPMMDVIKAIIHTANKLGKEIEWICIDENETRFLDYDEEELQTIRYKKYGLKNLAFWQIDIINHYLIESLEQKYEIDEDYNLVLTESDLDNW